MPGLYLLRVKPRLHKRRIKKAALCVGQLFFLVGLVGLEPTRFMVGRF